MPTKPRPVRSIGLHSYLVAIALAALIPGLVAAGLALWGVGKSFRDNAQERLSMTARTLAGGVELDLDRLALTLLPLATEYSLYGTGDVSVVQPIDTARGREWLGGRVWRVVLVNGKPERPLPQSRIDMASIQSALRTGRPVLSNLYDDAGGALRVMVIVPIAGDGDPHASDAAQAVLVFAAGPEALVRLPRSVGADASDILVAVTDGTGRLIARSRGAGKFVGRVVPDWAALKAHGGSSGRFEARTTEGRSVTLAFETLSSTPGWVLVVGEPRHHFDATWLKPLTDLAAGALVALLAAVAAAFLIGRRILAPVKALTRRGAEVAQRIDGAPIPPSSVREFEQLRQNFEAAEHALRERAESNRLIAERLASSERRYRAIAETGAVALWRSDPQARMKSVSAWRELTGMPAAGALDEGWLHEVHPEDREAITRGWSVAGSDGKGIDVEFRVRAADGTWRWVRARGVMTAGEDGSTPECVGVLEDVNERRQAQDRVAHMAHHDPLTGLANRVLLRTRLEEAIRYAGRGRHAALHCLDLDRFKEVNDAHGHAIGDRLLNGVADRLRACTRDVDVIARLGGDEFAIIQFDGGRDGSADTLARRLVEALCRPYELDGLMVVVGASVGIATINDINNGPDVLLRHADLALYRAKEEGRGCYRFFEPEMDAGMPERPRLKLDLRRAATANEFEPWYQPRINLRDASLSGFEALMRWNHPVHGVLPPARFLPGLEETGLIRQVGQDLLVKACREAVRWPVSLRLSVNLSAAQLLQHDIVAVVAHALDSTGLAAERLELEVTETAINADPEAAAKALAQLHALGVRLAMDDFGAGHSSLGCLRTLPFDRVKIDRSFVRTALHDDQSRAMIRAVISLCADLGIETTAVGVESEDQLALLTVGTCSEAQGYLFGAPRPLADLARRPSPILDMPRPTALVGPGDVSTVD